MREQLSLLARPSKTITPGRYRCYLAPDAVNKLLSLLNWGGFSYDAAHAHTSPFMPLVNKEAVLDKNVTISYAPGILGVPSFDAWGFCFDEDITIIKNGEIDNLLVSARDAKKQTITANISYDYSDALTLASSTLNESAILKNLDTGIYISNLWYCNYSDQPRGRITGMTRFASLWVEDGEIVAPLHVMRFDDSVLSLFGAQLIDLDDTATLITDSSTYDARQFAVSQVPGILVASMTFTH